MNAMHVLEELLLIAAMTGLSLLVLILPVLTLIWTVYKICCQGDFSEIKSLLRLNLVLAGAVVLLVVTSGSPTFYRVAEFSYNLTLIVGFISSALILYSVVMHKYGPDPLVVEIDQ